MYIVRTMKDFGVWARTFGQGQIRPSNDLRKVRRSFSVTGSCPAVVPDRPVERIQVHQDNPPYSFRGRNPTLILFCIPGSELLITSCIIFALSRKLAFCQQLACVTFELKGQVKWCALQSTAKHVWNSSPKRLKFNFFIVHSSPMWQNGKRSLVFRLPLDETLRHAL